MLQKIKYETLNFGRYEKLRKKFQNPDFEPDELKELELSYQRATELPSFQIFNLIKHLQVLILSNNCICRFDANILIKSAPKLELLDLSNNLIDIIDDLIELGSLKNLQFLEFSNNPICEYMIRIKIVKCLLYPEKYKKYDPVAILTADYHAIPNPRLSPKEAAQQKLDEQIVEKFPEELEPDECRVAVSKYNHKNTLAKYTAVPCPIPRKSRFPNLRFLNGEFISKFDVMRASGQRTMQKILYDAKEQEEIRQEKEEKRKIKEILKKSKTHEMHLANYKKKIGKQLQVSADQQKIEKLDNEDDLAYMARLDQADFKNQKKQAISQKKFAQDIWEVPQDVIYKDAEFNISIKNYKKMQQEYQAEHARKHQQAEERKKKKQRLNRPTVLKRLQQDGFGDGDGKEFASGMSEGLESDIEVRKLFKKKKEKRKPKLNLEQNDVDDYRSSQSSQSESIHLENQSSFSESNHNNQEQISLSPNEGGEYKISDEESEQGGQIADDLSHSEAQKGQPKATKGIHKEQKKDQQQAQQPAVDILELRKQLQQSEKDKEKLVKSRKSNFIAQIATGSVIQHSNKEAQQSQSIVNEDYEYKKQNKDNSEEKDEQLQNIKSTKDTLPSETTYNNSIVQDFGKKGQTITVENQSNNLIAIKTEESEQQQKSHFSQNPAMIEIQKNIMSNEALPLYKPYDLVGTPFQMVQQQSLGTLPVKEFPFDQQLQDKRTNPKVKKNKSQSNQSFKISNKIFFNHSATAKQQQQQMQQKIMAGSNKKAGTITSNSINIKSQQENSNIDAENQYALSSNKVHFRPGTSQLLNSKLLASGDHQTRVPAKDYIDVKDQKAKNRVTNVIEKSRVIVKGDLNTMDFVKSDVPIENLLPQEQHGVPAKFLITYLHDPRNDTHQQIKYYKKIIDKANNLIEGHKEMERKLEITSIKKKPITEIREAIPFNKVIDYLSTDKNFCLQNSYDPAEKTIYQVTRNAKQFQQTSAGSGGGGGIGDQSSTNKMHHQNSSSNVKRQASANGFQDKLSTYDLREIIYKANNYDTQFEPKITEKDVLEKLSNKQLSFEEKIKYYDWLQLLEEIKLLKNKGNKASLNRLEKKEIERAENNAHLAYHYQRLRKYMPEEIIDNQLLQLGIRQDNKGAIKFKSNFKKKQNSTDDNAGLNKLENNLLTQVPNVRTSQKKKSTAIRLNTEPNNVVDQDVQPHPQQQQAEQGEQQQLQQKSERGKQPQESQSQQGFFKHIDKLMEIKAECRPIPLKDEIRLTGTIVEDIPNINEVINKKKFVQPPMISFEEMVDQNLRKIQGQFQKTQAGMLSLEEQMMRQAQEFKNKVKERENLKANIEQYIQENQKKLDEFQEWDAAEHDKRHDKDYCFKMYVKMVRESRK